MSDVNNELVQARRTIEKLENELLAYRARESAWLALEHSLRASEQALREREERYHTLVDLASEGIVVSDSDGRVLEVNRAGCELLGYTESELRERTLAQLGVGDLTEEHLERGESVVLSQQLISKDGSGLDVEISARRLPDGRVHSILRDVTERTRAQTEHARLEEQLRHSQKLESIGRLAGGIAHDFNNLLTVILANSGFLLAELDKDDPRSAHARLISESGERAAGLTRQLLAFSRKQVAQPRVLDLGEVLEDAQRMLRRVVGEDVVLSVDAAADAGLVLTDPSQIEQVLLNLVVNARDAMPNGGSLRLSIEPAVLRGSELTTPTVSTPGPYVVLRVSDSGEGMTLETQERLFEPFFTTKELGKGTGLGLATVYGIVTQAGGCISVQSAPQKGTTFCLYFPAVEGEVQRPPPEPPLMAAQPTRAERGSHTILLTEDDVNVATVARQVLTNAGYELLVARGGLEALQLFLKHQNQIDLLITDVVMQGMTGPELATELHFRAPHLPVLYMSGYLDASVASRAAPGFSEPLLQKPFSPQELIAHVECVFRTESGSS